MIHHQLYLRGSSKKLLNVQLIYKQRSSNTVNCHANMGLAVGNLQQFLDVLRITEPKNKVNRVLKCQKSKQLKKKATNLRVWHHINTISNTINEVIGNSKTKMKKEKELDQWYCFQNAYMLLKREKKKIFVN